MIRTNEIARSGGWLDGARYAALVLVVPLAGACSVGDLELAGKACPCAEGWQCDAASNVCVPMAVSGQGGGGSGSGGAPSGGGGLGGDGGSGTPGPGAIQVTDLHVVWTTPNWIRWEWASEGTPDELLRYELVTGTSAEDVESRTGSAIVWTAEQNPELGRFFLPATGGEDQVIATMTDEHLPSTEYYGALTAVDTANRRSTSNVAAGRTSDPPGHELVIFSDEATPGYSIPDTFVLSDRDPYAGTHHYDYQLESCAEPTEPMCFEILRRQGLGTDLTGITQGAFSTTAYVELALASGGPTPSYWSQLRIQVGTDGDADSYLLGAWTIRADGDYRLYQFPLRAIGWDGPMPYEALARGLHELGVGGNWTAGVPTMVDEIRIWW
jgi:hypothetical protein